MRRSPTGATGLASGLSTRPAAPLHSGRLPSSAWLRKKRTWEAAFAAANTLLLSALIYSPKASIFALVKTHPTKAWRPPDERRWSSGTSHREEADRHAWAQSLGSCCPRTLRDLVFSSRNYHHRSGCISNARTGRGSHVHDQIISGDGGVARRDRARNARCSRGAARKAHAGAQILLLRRYVHAARACLSHRQASRLHASRPGCRRVLSGQKKDSG